MLKQIGSGVFKSTCLYPLKEVVRYKRNIVKKKLTLNPGIQHRAKLLKDNHESEFDVDEMESMEADFMKVGTSHRDHLEEMRKFKDKEKVFIVKQKYFKEKSPNFLTWSDKQQIQYLHRTNPEEWTIEKLSDGFPALPDTIKKIVKTNWSKSSSKIQNHDNSVKKNWALFKYGQLNLSPTLTEHLNKFTNRKYDFNSQNTINEEDTKKLTSKVNGEFSEIIKSYERLRNKDGLNNKDEEPPPKKEKNYRTLKETYLIEKQISEKKNTTLKSLKDSLVRKSSLGKELDEDDKLLLTVSNSVNKIEDATPENVIIDLKDISKTAYVSTNIKTEKDLRFLEYPEKILIPEDKLKPGCTYKLNDCYYDCDGLFLYRVPGMDK